MYIYLYIIFVIIINSLSFYASFFYNCFIFFFLDGPRQSQANVSSSRLTSSKKSSSHKLETESTDDSDQEGNKNKTGTYYYCYYYDFITVIIGTIHIKITSSRIINYLIHISFIHYDTH